MFGCFELCEEDVKGSVGDQFVGFIYFEFLERSVCF